MPITAREVALLPGVHAAVLENRDRIAGTARALFAAHDNPGGHEITVSDGGIDGYVWLEGEAPGAVEDGHIMSGMYARGSARGRFVPGLNVLKRAAGSA